MSRRNRESTFGRSYLLQLCRATHRHFGSTRPPNVSPILGPLVIARFQHCRSSSQALHQRVLGVLSTPPKHRAGNECRGRRCQRRLGCWQHPPRSDTYFPLIPKLLQFDVKDAVLLDIQFQATAFGRLILLRNTFRIDGQGYWCPIPCNRVLEEGQEHDPVTALTQF